MELLRVTKDIAIRAVLFWACKIPEVEKFISDFSVSDLVWAERIFSIKELKKFVRPIWTLSGYGDGYGYGYGYGNGNGDGYGYGNGYGNGNGDGDGDGYGYGNGDGYGYGNGYGNGNGDGYGDGDIGAKVLTILGTSGV